MSGMDILIDQNVDNKVGDVFRYRGHAVQLVRDLPGAQASDHLIALTVCDQGLIIVTHDGDFRRFQRLIAVGARNLDERGHGHSSLSNGMGQLVWSSAMACCRNRDPQSTKSLSEPAMQWAHWLKWSLFAC
jgi:Domain of unknown function (DUF5615)